MQLTIVKELLKNKELFYQTIFEEKDNKKIWSYNISLILASVLLFFVYGFTMGIHHSFAQAVSSMIKLPVLFYLSIIICYPAMFTYNAFLGSRMNFAQSIALIISALTLTSAILASFFPICLFFIVIESSYEFIVILHVLLLSISGIAGMSALISGLKSACENYSIYPKLGIKIFRIWIVIFGFVGTQLAYNLKPFVGSPDLPFELFRHSTGNFYTLLLDQLKNLLF